MSTTISDDLKLTWTVATPTHNYDAFEGGASALRVARLTSFEKGVIGITETAWLQCLIIK